MHHDPCKDSIHLDSRVLSDYGPPKSGSSNVQFGGAHGRKASIHYRLGAESNVYG